MKLRYFLALSIIIFATLPSLSIDKEATIDSLRRELKVAQNPDDSITILYNMYDLSPRPKKEPSDFRFTVRQPDWDVPIFNSI